MSYAFLLDASACSGCKACQAACKDKNQLPLGVLWRRVYEVSGGEWKQAGQSWSNTVFAYNLSLSCNHCEHPKCAGVCPVDAYTVRADGLVLLDSSKCIGCGYCAWACPYGAPQYDEAAGTMTKCNFCYDNLDLGLPPACVSACPLRALDYMEVSDQQSTISGQRLEAREYLGDKLVLWDLPAGEHPYPMPDRSRTEPHLVIKPHAAMKRTEEKFVANREEVYPQQTSGWEEAPLVVFTLLIQMAVGGFWAMLWLFHGVPQYVPMLGIGLCLGAGMLASFAHLGRKRNAWRVLNHLRKSWLSREILFTILFGTGWLVILVSMILHTNIFILNWLSAWIGLVLIYGMSRVYLLPAVPVWNSWRTQARFFISAALLGILGVLPMLTQMNMPVLEWRLAGGIVIFLLIAQGVIAAVWPLSIKWGGIQLGLIAAGLIGCVMLFFMPGWFGTAFSLFVFLIILAEEVLGRWCFYQVRT
jgi:anaerobic dimethyl sulfoxide reductase subunit B (iron-sulfur subunit)